MKKGLLHHVEIYVKDLEKSNKFWSWFLPKMGYTVYQKWDEGISYLLGETYLVFVQIEERFSDIDYHRCRAGLNHLAFHGGSREEVEQLTTEIKEQGYKILYADRHPYAGGKGYFAVYFENSERMKIEVVADSD